jgi:site-specific DNA-methyltransferase (adenine-specific)
MTYKIICGNNTDVLKTYPDNHFDSIVTDPPYGIDFLGKDWDANTGALETYQECFRVLKPGGHILAFSAARTYHHLAVTIEQAGFEIRDQIMWIYSSGFPKSQDIGKQIEKKINKSLGKPNKVIKKLDMSIESNTTMGFGGAGKNGHSDAGLSGEIIEVTHPQAKAWSGWGTALKPAHEPICLARKPIKGSIRENCLKYGTGALNIDATRVPYEDDDSLEDLKTTSGNNASTYKNFSAEERTTKDQPRAGKRTASFHSATGNPDAIQSGGDGSGGWEASQIGRFPSNVIGEISEPYQKYFYCPKVSRKERHAGFDTSTIATNPAGMYDADGTGQQYNPQKKIGEQGNNHPTVKPIELMKYLIKLVTPAGGTVLDPFNGSGSTGCAAVELGFNYVGIDLDPAYVDISERRIEAWNKGGTTFNNLFDE